VPRDPGPTREKLLDAAERLFASRGLSVSLEEISGAAGQRNNTAVQYHFTNKAGLLRAILDRQRPIGTARRDEILTRARADKSDLRMLASVIVLPTAEYLDRAEEGRSFLRVLAAIVTDSTRSETEIADLLVDPAHSGVAEELAARSGIAPDVALRRVYTLSAAVLHLCADRARYPAGSAGDSLAAPDAEFVDDLLDLCTGALGAPSSRSTPARPTPLPRRVAKGGRSDP
jgi:AcrR family transcriptional regulator